MDFGIYLTFRNPRAWRRPIAEVYRDQVADAVHAEELGYGHVWTSEHHFRDDAWSPSLFPILGTIAGQTRRIRLGTYILILPFHNPVQIAEDSAILDILSGGRLDLGVGPGNFLSEYQTFGVPRAERRPRMHEGLEIIRRAFTEERFSFKGAYHEFPNVVLSPKPLQQPHPPIWVAAIGPKAIAEAAGRGYHLAGGGPPQSPRLYDEVLHAAGRVPEHYKIAQFRVMYLAETREQAWDDAEQHVHYLMTSYDDEFKRAQDLLSQEFTTPPVAEPGALRNLQELTFNGATIFVGTPDEAIADLRRYFGQARMTHSVLWMHLPGLDSRKARHSMELFARNVMPHFQD
jgi:alkanesulfonate monooxygenase SsuD/methylene tetrahydromethanopterin reductase-like flavin-dependent oxidoreductase (luciferase family)